MQDSIKMQPDETIKDYKIRLFRNKTLYNLKPQAIADLINNVAGTNFNESTFRKWWAIYNEALEDCKSADTSLIQETNSENNETKYKSSIEYKNGNVTSDKLIEICDNEEMTPEFLMQKHGLDSSKWSVVSYKNNYWHSQVKDGKQIVMYQSKITVKPEYDKLDLSKVEEWFNKFTPTKVDWNKYQVDKNDDNCLVLPVADLHWNLLSTAFITGNEYNIKIATENFYKIINDTYNRVMDKKISKVFLVLGNDMFNANGINGETFKGTPQTNECHAFEAYIKLIDVVVSGIDKLKEIAEIEVVFVPSNHDKENAMYFMVNLYTYYRLDENVKVDYSPLPRKYRKFGSTLFLFTHDMKINNVGKIILDEARELLQGVEYYEVMLAHLHSESVKQDGNITLRRLPTTSGDSAWSNDSAYGAKKVHQSFVYNNITSISDCMYVSV